MSKDTTIASTEDVLVRGRHRIPMTFCISIKAQVEFRLPAQIPGVTYTTRSLCGMEFWRPLSRGEKNWAGVCLLYLVEQGELPLIHLGMNSSHSEIYCL